MLASHKLVAGLRLRSIQVPAAVANGSQVTLVCQFQLDGDQLYAVKWYKDYIEFYRYEPSQGSGISTSGTSSTNDATSNLESNFVSQGSKRQFELDGINMNLAKSNESHVYLNQVTLNSEGTYKCEVSSESRGFVTVFGERDMRLFALPKHKLTIIEQVESSKRSDWTPPNTNNRNRVNSEPQITPAYVNLNGIQQQQHQQQQQQLHIAIGAQNQVTRYKINDLVNLTCISSASYPAAKLSWLLNDQSITAMNNQLLASSRSGTNGEPNNINNNTSASANSSNTTSANYNNLNYPFARWFNVYQYQSLEMAPNWSMSNNNNNNNNNNLATQSKISNINNKQPVETRLRLTFRLEPKLLSYLARFASNSIQGINLVSLSCQSKLELVYSSESSIGLVAGEQLMINQRRRPKEENRDQLTPETQANNEPSEELALAQNSKDTTLVDGGDLHIKLQSNIRDNDSINQPHSRWHHTNTGVIKASQLNMESMFEIFATSQHNENPIITLRPRQLAGYQRWTKRELQEQADWIASQLEINNPNELDKPDVTVTSTVNSDNQDNDSDERSFNSTSNYDIVQLECKPRFGARGSSAKFGYHSTNSPEQALDRLNIKSNWLINGNNIQGTKVNEYDKMKGFTFSGGPRPSALSQVWTVRQPQAHQTTPQPESSLSSDKITQFGDSFNDNLNYQKSINHKNHIKQLMLELNPSIVQVKELDIKCQTYIEQTLIRFENRFVLAFQLSDQNKAIGGQTIRGYQLQIKSKNLTDLSRQQRTKQQVNTEKQRHQDFPSSKIDSSGANQLISPNILSAHTLVVLVMFLRHLAYSTSAHIIS